MKEGRTWKLIARKLTREALPEELEELKELLQSDEVLEEKFEVITEFWNRRDKKAAAKTSEAFNSVWQKTIYDQ